MRALGIVRKVDDLGRIVIPKELRRVLGIEQGESMEVLADEKGVYIRKYVAGCTFCKGMELLVDFGGVHVCKKCAKEILMLDGSHIGMSAAQIRNIIASHKE